MDDGYDPMSRISLVLAGDRQVGWIGLDTVDDPTESNVARAAETISADGMISADTPVLEVVKLFSSNSRHFYFVLQESQITGTVHYEEPREGLRPLAGPGFLAGVHHQHGEYDRGNPEATSEQRRKQSTGYASTRMSWRWFGRSSMRGSVLDIAHFHRSPNPAARKANDSWITPAGGPRGGSVTAHDDSFLGRTENSTLVHAYDSTPEPNIIPLCQQRSVPCRGTPGQMRKSSMCPNPTRL
jgi:hypothetical protein